MNPIQSKLQQTIQEKGVSDSFTAVITNPGTWKVANFDIDLHNLPKGDISALPSTITGYFAQNKEHQGIRIIKQILKKTESKFSQELEQYPEVAVPTAKGMQKIASYYNARYGISITNVRLNDLDYVLLEKMQEFRELQHPMYIGIVVDENEESIANHVIPMIVSFTPQEKKRLSVECFIMDVTGISDPLGPDAACLDNRLRAKLAECKLPVVNSDGFRQADTKSCRIGSLVILRNALLYLKKHPFKDGLIKNLKSIEAGFFTRLKESPELKNLSAQDLKMFLGFIGINPDTLPKAVAIPDEWAYMEQIYKPRQDVTVIRDLFSSKPEKHEAPKTASVYRKKYEEECTFVAKIVIQAAKNFSLFKGLLEKTALPREVVCTFSPEDSSITFTIRIAKRINTYLQNKALRFVNKLSPIESGLSSLSLNNKQK